MGTEGETLEVVEDRRLGRSRLATLLSDLEKKEPQGGFTVCSKAGGFQEWVQSTSATNGPAPSALSLVAPSVGDSETGSVVFWSESGGIAVLPPFPLETHRVLAGWDTSPLRALLARKYVIGVVLLRLGRYSVGVFGGQALVSSKTGTRYVKGKHSAGGTSQKRFERIRDKQIQEMLAKTCSVVKDQFTPYEGSLDHILLGGEKFTLLNFRKRCDYLQRLSPRILGRVLNVRQPKRVTLEGAIDEVWESRVLTVRRGVDSPISPGV